jgi:hypothetical protein
MADQPEISGANLVDRAIDNLHDKIMTRLNAMDKATSLLHENVSRVPTDMDRQLTHLREVLGVKITEVSAVSSQRFERIDNQFTERDKRSDQAAMSGQKAIDAGLLTQKEAAAENTKSMTAAINKSEAAFAEAIKQLQTLSQSESKATNDKIAVVVSRIDKGEGVIRGTADHTITQQGSNANIIAIVAIIAAAIMSLAVMFSHTSTPAPLLTGMPPISSR